jgi:hypothetical protein
MALIDLSNYDTLLNQSTTGGRSGTANGNIYFNTTSGIMEVITVEEQATVIITDSTHPQYTDGTSPITNPLGEDDGIKLEAIYAFERQERRKDEELRKHDYFLEGTFKFGGAYKFVNDRKLYDTDAGGGDSLTGDDRYKMRGSGWEELDIDGELCRIYYGNKSLGNIEALSVPYYQLADTASPDTNGIVPVPYAKDGPIDEAVQVFGDITYDANTTTFDTRVFESLKIRSYGFNYDEKILSDSGVTEMGGYNTGFALTESIHLTTNTTGMPLAEVYNSDPASQVGVWEAMELEEFDAPQSQTGFTTSDADFTWVLSNANGASLDEMIAHLDALAQVDADINAHAVTETYGQRVGTWYSYNAAGKILPEVGTGAAGEGLFLSGLIGTDKNRVIFTDDAGATKEYPFYLAVAVNVGSGAVADTNAWFHAFYLDGPGAGDDFNTDGALTVEDADASTLIKGNVNGSGIRSGNIINFEYNFASDPVSGGGETDVVFECEGDGGVTAAKTVFTLSDPANAASITASCVPGVENNV